MSDRAILSDAMLDQMASQGLIPPECSRVIIDLQVGDVIRIHYTCFGTDKLLATSPALLGARVICAHESAV